MDVFAAGLKYMKDTALKRLKARHIVSKLVSHFMWQHSTGGVVRGKDIQWVVTIPAIWKNGAKQLMREGGLKSQRLALLLLPRSGAQSWHD